MILTIRRIFIYNNQNTLSWQLMQSVCAKKQAWVDVLKLFWAREETNLSLQVWKHGTDNTTEKQAIRGDTKNPSTCIIWSRYSVISNLYQLLLHQCKCQTLYPVYNCWWVIIRLPCLSYCLFHFSAHLLGYNFYLQPCWMCCSVSTAGNWREGVDGQLHS